jgi:hypothetical protein
MRINSKRLKRIKEILKKKVEYQPDEEDKEDFLLVLPQLVDQVKKMKSFTILLYPLAKTDEYNYWWFDSICVHLFKGFPEKKAIEAIYALVHIYLDHDILGYIEDPIISQRWAIIETFAREFLKCQKIQFIPRAMMLRRRCTRFSINLALFRAKMAVCFSRTNGKKEIPKILTAT